MRVHLSFKVQFVQLDLGVNLHRMVTKSLTETGLVSIGQYSYR